MNDSFYSFHLFFKIVCFCFRNDNVLQWQIWLVGRIDWCELFHVYYDGLHKDILKTFKQRQKYTHNGNIFKRLLMALTGEQGWPGGQGKHSEWK